MSEHVFRRFKSDPLADFTFWAQALLRAERKSSKRVLQEGLIWIGLIKHATCLTICLHATMKLNSVLTNYGLRARCCWTLIELFKTTDMLMMPRWMSWVMKPGSEDIALRSASLGGLQWTVMTENATKTTNQTHLPKLYHNSIKQHGYTFDENIRFRWDGEETWSCLSFAQQQYFGRKPKYFARIIWTIIKA